MSMYAESLRAFLKPILPLLDDPDVTEVMINGPAEIWAEKSGKVYRTPLTFTEEGLQAAARNMAQFVGRVLSDERPRLDARLPDGSRIHVVLAPVARRGTTIAIRKFSKDKLTMQRLVDIGSTTPAMAKLIDAAVKMKLNVVVAGGTGSGKTTLLNVLSRFIPDDERILTIEDSAELQLQQPHIVAFESRPPDKHGKGEVTLGDLLTSALRLRPDRIVVGEVRGGECFYLLQAMNTGHGGSLATTHANTPTDTLRRLESLCLLSGVDLPMVAVRAQVASAIHLVVCCDRLSDGSRKLTHVSEVLPLSDKGDYRTQDLFVFTQTGKDPKTGKVRGYHAPTGILPTFLSRMRAYGFEDVDESFFDPSTYKVPPPPIFRHDGEVRTRWAPSLKHRESGEADPDGLMDQFPMPVEPEPAPAPSRARDPEPKELERSPLTAETPAAGIPAPPPPAPPKAPSALSQPPKTVAPPAPAHDDDDDEKTAAEPAARRAPASPPPKDEPSIQIADDLLDDLQKVVSNDQTYVKQNPLAPKPNPPSNPPAARPAPPRPAPKAPPAPEADDLEVVEDDRTDPHIRMPQK